MGYHKLTEYIHRLIRTKGVMRSLIASVVLIVLIFVFSVRDPLFGGYYNVSNILNSIAPILLVGIGQSIVLISGHIDLSIGTTVGISSMMSATLMTHGMPYYFAILITLFSCGAFGLLNGILVGRMRIPSYIATIATLILGEGITQLVAKNVDTAFVGHAARGFRNLFFYGKFLSINNSVWIAVIIWVIMLILLSKTRTGRYVHAVGRNPVAMRVLGVKIDSTIDISYVICAVCSGFAGLILTAELGYGEMDIGNNYEIYAIAAAVIGGITTLGGRGLLIGTAVGASLWCVLQNGLVRIGVPVAVQNVVVGVVIIFVVYLDVKARQGKSGIKRLI
ncbi:MAG: ABC transporter permease [Clostridiales Family XIII bacterium]|jgi:ribose transport system permease protein|nr:ABC transporter permease [Clostridiales Family XIII bacterium]